VDVQKITHEVRLQNWSRIVTDCRSSGQTVKAWCESHHINIKTYYYWQKRVCQATCRDISITKEQNVQAMPAGKEPVFAELPTISNRNRGELAVTIHRKDIQIHIYGGADVATVETALLALKNLC
jgi:hypothetical protein